MRCGLIVLWMLLWSVTSAIAQVNIGIGLPGVSIGINLPLLPELVRVPGYPVYYAPRLDSNFFFYDGMYWVYQGDNWYASSWYNGPWGLVAPAVVPLFVLRIPVRYYRDPPALQRCDVARTASRPRGNRGSRAQRATPLAAYGSIHVAAYSRTAAACYRTTVAMPWRYRTSDRRRFNSFLTTA